MDMTETIAPRSDQLNSDDLMSGDRTFTIASVSKGNAEQPVAVRLVEFGDDRPYYPCKSMRRVMVAAWGKDAAGYVGRRLTLYCDPEVQWGGQKVGGIRIRAMSDLQKPLVIALTVTRAKRAPFKVLPLAEDAPKKPEVPLAQRIDAAVASFGQGGVRLDQLEKRIGRQRSEWTAGDLGDLTGIFQALKKGEITKDKAFPPVALDEDPTANGEMPDGGVRQ